MKKASVLALILLVVLSFATVATAAGPTLPPQAPQLTLPPQAQASDNCPLVEAAPQFSIFGIMVPPVEI